MRLPTRRVYAPAAVVIMAVVGTAALFATLGGPSTALPGRRGGSTVSLWDLLSTTMASQADGVTADASRRAMSTCPPVAHVVWPFSMPLGAREAVAVRSLLVGALPPMVTQHGPVAAAPVPWTRVVVHVAHEALAFVDDHWTELASHAGAAAKVAGLTIEPIHLSTLFESTPLQPWVLRLTLWKVLSGPDFAYQLETAVRLALAWTHGGHVFPADFVRSPRWAPPSHPYVVQGPDGPALWPARLGPMCAYPKDSRVWALLERMAHDLDGCSAASRRHTSGAAVGVPCALTAQNLFAPVPGQFPLADECDEPTEPILQPHLSPDDLRGDSDHHTPAAASCPYGHRYGAGTLWAPFNFTAGTDQACGPRGVLDDACTGGHNGAAAADPEGRVACDDHALWGVGEAFAAGPYIGAVLAHRLLGQRRLSPCHPLAQTLGLFGCGTDCLVSGYPWHQGCRPAPALLASISGSSGLGPGDASLAARLAAAKYEGLDNAHLTSFGMLTARASRNSGDDIQTLAAASFLPFVGFTIDRDHWDRIEGMPSSVPPPARSLSSSAEVGSIFTIVNGWWNSWDSEAESFPRNATALRSVVVGMHLDPHLLRMTPSDKFVPSLRRYGMIFKSAPGDACHRHVR